MLDVAVDKLSISSVYGDPDRVEHLFGLYEKPIAPITVALRRTGGREARVAA
jgi:hypothetical protein